MSILTTLEADLATAWSSVQHGAIWLFGAASAAKQDLETMEASNPMVQMAVKAGEAVAEAHGVPIQQIETAADDVLAAAQAIAGASPPAAS